jgi:glycosidase
LRTLHEKLFHAGYDWVLYLILKDIWNHRRPPGDIIRWETEQRRLYPDKKLLLRFTENHDLPRTRDIFGAETYQVFAGLPYCLEGLPLIYAGQEWGIPVMPDLFEKDPVPWQNGDQDVHQFYRKLIALRREHPALAGGNIEKIPCKSDDILIFRKNDRDESLIVVANFGDRQAVFLPEKYQGRYTDLLSGEWVDGDRLHPDPFNLMILLQKT